MRLLSDRGLLLDASVVLRATGQLSGESPEETEVPASAPPVYPVSV